MTRVSAVEPLPARPRFLTADELCEMWPALRNPAPPVPGPKPPNGVAQHFRVATEFAALADRVAREGLKLRVPAQSTAGLVGPIGGRGNCLAPILDGHRVWIDPTLPAQDGDFVLVRFAEETRRLMVERCKGRPGWREEYGDGAEHALKLLLWRCGQFWLVTNESALPLDGSAYFGPPSQILGVVRRVAHGDAVAEVSAIHPNAATATYVTTIAGPGSHNSGVSGDVTITVPAQTADYTAIVTITGDFVEGGSPGAAPLPTLDAKQRYSPGPGGDTLAGNTYDVKNVSTTAGGTYERITLQGQFSAVASQAYYYGYYWTNDDAVNNPVNWQNVQIQVVAVFR
jgi:hypothetical protein